jgi:hypothetical protein
MGEWGYKPMEGDVALDWLANEVDALLLGAIRRALEAYLGQTERDDVKLTEAEAAVGLLIDLAGDHTRMKYTRFASGFLARKAKEEQLLSLATKAVAQILTEEEWLQGWTSPQLKKQALEELLADLRHIETIAGD